MNVCVCVSCDSYYTPLGVVIVYRRKIIFIYDRGHYYEYH